LEERERAGNKEGVSVGKGKRAGGIGQKAIFYLSNRTEAGEGADRAAGPAGAPGSVAAEGRQEQRGGRGLPIPVLTLVEDDLWRRLHGKERPAAEVGGGGANGCGGGARERCWGLMMGWGTTRRPRCYL
jgi:hypothetical protein